MECVYPTGKYVLSVENLACLLCVLTSEGSESRSEIEKQLTYLSPTIQSFSCVYKSASTHFSEKSRLKYCSIIPESDLSPIISLSSNLLVETPHSFNIVQNCFTASKKSLI